MKQILILTILSVITSASFAQINKGQWLMGGNIGFSSTKSRNVLYGELKSNTFQLSPNAGYFITDKLAAGARVSFNRTENGQEVSSTNLKYTTTKVSLSPFIRYYFLPKTEKLNLFADAGYAYGRTKYTAKTPVSNPSSEKTTTHGYYVSAGPALFLTPNTALELTLTYNYSKQKGYDFNDKGFLAGIGFQIHLGK